MKTLCKLIAAVALAAQLAAPAWAIWSAGNVSAHTHATVAQGGALGNVTLGDITFSSGNVTGNYFSVGSSTFVVTGGRVGIGAATLGAALHILRNGAVDAVYQLLLAGNSNNNDAGGEGAAAFFAPDGTVRAWLGFLDLPGTLGGDTFNIQNRWGDVTIAAHSSGWDNHRLTVKGDTGNVGIGTTAPGVRLAVQQATDSFLQQWTDGTVDMRTYIQTAGPTYGSLFTFSNHALALGTNNSVKLKVYPDGGLGLGGNHTDSVSQGAGSFGLNGHIALGPTTGTGGQGVDVFAVSVDGASQSSGCVVNLAINSSGANGVLQFTSTTTISNAMAGALMENCAPAAVCRVRIKGFAHVQTTGGVGAPAYIQQSGTRCQASGNATLDSNNIGRMVATSPAGAGSWGWAYLGL